jgi:outer membrane immunogenic protein
VRGTVFDLLVELRRTVVTLRSGTIVVCMVRAPRRCVTLDQPEQVVIVTAATIQGPSTGGPTETQFAESCLSAIDRAACVIALPRQAESVPPSSAPTPSTAAPGLPTRRVRSVSPPVGPVSPSVSQVGPRVSQISPSVSQPASGVGQGWEGFYLGIQVGGARGSVGLRERGASQCFRDPVFPFPVAPTCPETPFSFGDSPTGFSGGALLGYTVKLGAVVLGIEGNLSWTHLGSSRNQPVPPFTLDRSIIPFGPRNIATRNEGFSGSISQAVGGSFNGRFGFVATSNVMVYGIGGVAIERVSGNLTYLATVNNLIDDFAVTESTLTGTDTTYGLAQWSVSRLGPTGGGGVELDVGGRMRMRLEWRYTDFGNFSVNVPLTRTTTMPAVAAPNSGPPNANADINVRFQTLTLGLVFAL